MEVAERIRNLPPYLFAQIDAKIAQAKANGVDVISLGIGDPDRPTPDHIVERLKAEAANPANHRYPSYEGLPEFRRAVAEWYKKRFDVELDPIAEVVSLIGSKEGIAHVPLCFVNPGDYVIAPDPGYPVYSTGTLFAGGQTYFVPLKAERNYLPNLSEIPEEIARKAKILFINYPNNPTGAVATLEFFAEVVEFAKRYDILVCHDAAYTEVYFEEPQPSFLQAPGAGDVGIEFHSLSKTYNMTGWRLGWAAGNGFAIEALGRLKTNIDSGVFQAIQYAGIEALRGPEEPVARMRDLYRRRRDIVVEELRSMGCPVSAPKASIYVWAPVPAGKTSTEFATELLEKAGVVVTPGIGYGKYGEGYFRISVCIEEDRIKEAFERIRRAGVRW